MNINYEAQDHKLEDKSELEKKLEEVESLLSGLADSETEDTWDEEEMIKNETVVQFVLNSGQTVQGPEHSLEDNLQHHKNSLRGKCLLKTQTVLDLENLEVSLLVLPDISTPDSPTVELLGLVPDGSCQEKTRSLELNAGQEQVRVGRR